MIKMHQVSDLSIPFYFLKTTLETPIIMVLEIIKLKVRKGFWGSSLKPEYSNVYFSFWKPNHISPHDILVTIYYQQQTDKPRKMPLHQPSLSGKGTVVWDKQIIP